MTDHLPECPKHADRYAMAGCICPSLRACEQRLTEGWCKAQCANSNFEAGLDAAREAVVSAVGDRITDLLTCNKDDDCHMKGLGAELALDDALVAIDALREEQK